MPINTARQQSLLTVLARGAALGVLAMLLVYATNQQQEQRTTAPLLPVTFAHADHTAHNCAACHHNFIDGTGQGFCFDCHKQDQNIAADMESMFHGLCQDCHVELALIGKSHGPVRACQQCHLADMAP